MYTSFLVGSIVALSVGRTVAAGMAWAGANIGGFDFGCDTTVRSESLGTRSGRLLIMAAGNVRSLQGYPSATSV